MERHQWFGPDRVSATGSTRAPSYRTPAERSGLAADLPQRRRNDANAVYQTSVSGEEGSERITRLSLNEFCERVALLAELELPCSVHIANPSAEQISRGVVRKIERDADRLNLLGEGFSLHLHRDNIDSIWLVTGAGDDEQGMAIEIHNRTGSLIARLFGMQDSVGAAVWQDVMGNPSLAIA